MQTGCRCLPIKETSSSGATYDDLDNFRQSTLHPVHIPAICSHGSIQTKETKSIPLDHPMVL